MTVSSNYTNAYSSYSSSATSSTKQTDKPSFEDLAKKLLSSMDTDNSGSIDKAEFSAAAQALASNSNSTDTNSTSATDVFNKLDTNSDGSMSSDELMSALKNSKPQGHEGSMPPPPPGGIPPSESSSASSESESSTSKTFAVLDTNEDGTVSIDELLASLETSKTDSSTASQTDTSSQKLSDMLLKSILSSYGNNAASSNTTSLLSISA